jgi:hypothetical protein
LLNRIDFGVHSPSWKSDPCSLINVGSVKKGNFSVLLTGPCCETLVFQRKKDQNCPQIPHHHLKKEWTPCLFLFNERKKNMTHRIGRLFLVGAILSVVGILANNSHAQDQNTWSFRAYTGFMPLAAGEAVKGTSTTVNLDESFVTLEFTGNTFSQSYSDVYTGGIPFVVEMVYRLNPQWSVHGGVGFQYFPAKSFTFTNLNFEGTINTPFPTPFRISSNLDGKLDDMYRIPIYFGGAYHLPTITKAEIEPYLRLDAGVIVQPAVDITFTPRSGIPLPSGLQKMGFWDTSILALVDGGLGVETQWKAVGVFAEVRVQYASAPSSAGGLNGINNSEGLVAVPLIIGMSF